MEGKAEGKAEGRAEGKREWCLGCQLRFQQGQKVTDENLTIEYKNYEVPIKEDKGRRTLLKTIVSFLNSRGGTIYIGIDDSSGAVQGQVLDRKQRDNFRLWLKQLLEKVHPRVDLNNRQEVLTQYIPVLSGGDFEGRFVVKIVVRQGDPSQLYCFGERVKLEAPTGKWEDFEVFYSYERHNHGGCSEVKGLSLLSLIASKAKQPNLLADTFHEGCNPEPPHMEPELRRIHFAGMTPGHQRTLEESFEGQFEEEAIDYQVRYLRDSATIELLLEDEDEFNFVKNYVVSNIAFINSEVFGGEEVHLTPRGVVGNHFLIDNAHQPQEKATKAAKPPSPLKQPKRQEQAKQERQPKAQTKWQKPPEPAREQPPWKQPRRAGRQERGSEKAPRKWSVVFTHIQPSAIDQLEKYLRSSICGRLDKAFAHFVNSMEVYLGGAEEQHRFLETCRQRGGQLGGFGFKGEIRFGVNEGLLRICNYDKNKKEPLRQMLRDAMQEDLLDASFVKEGNKFSLVCQMASRELACEWLDLLLQLRELRKFSIPRSKEGQAAKLKVYLEVGDVI